MATTKKIESPTGNNTSYVKQLIERTSVISYFLTHAVVFGVLKCEKLGAALREDVLDISMHQSVFLES